jgi:hypothetical protein
MTLPQAVVSMVHSMSAQFHSNLCTVSYLAYSNLLPFTQMLVWLLRRGPQRVMASLVGDVGALSFEPREMDL